MIRRDLSVHAGKNLIIPCIKNSQSVLWTHNGENISNIYVNVRDKNIIIK